MGSAGEQPGSGQRMPRLHQPHCGARDNDLATTHPWLAGQWHPDKNGALAPRNVVSGSRRRVWWRCEKGHEWMAAVNSRAHGAGCPVCSGKTVIPGDNDLASNWPELAAQWDQESNGSLRPDQVTTFCNQRVWWQCEKGHRWQAAINARATSGSGCPYCTGKRVLKGFNDLETLKPRIAAEWHPTLNGPLSPDMVTSGSAKRVWWQCAYGHVWRAIIYSRTGRRQCGCPVCAGKVKTRDKLNREYSFTPD